MREENKAKTRTKGQTADFELARGLKSLLIMKHFALMRIEKRYSNNMRVDIFLFSSSTTETFYF